MPFDYSKDEQVLEKFWARHLPRRPRRKIDPVIGRETRFGKIIQILARKTRHKRHPFRRTGVGKTAILEGLALTDRQKRRPTTFKDKIIYELDMGARGGAKYRGEFEERLKAVLKQDPPKRRQDSSFFIDEIHLIVGAGRTEGCPRRRQHAQTAVGPRRNRLHRGHDLERIPAVHRKRPGFGKEVPASFGPRANRGAVTISILRG
jgi:ATP-dependent Clp protease ATP-binding subunit ClpA